MRLSPSYTYLSSFFTELNGFRAGRLPFNPSLRRRRFMKLSVGMDTPGDVTTLAALSAVRLGSAREARMMFKFRTRVLQ